MQHIHATKHSLNSIFANVKGTAIVTINYCTSVTTQAKSPLRDKIVKHVEASVIIGNNLKDFTDLYVNKVKRTADDKEAAQDFVKSAASFEHTDFYSIVYNEKLNTYYLFALYNKVLSSTYKNLTNGNEMSKEEVAQELTASAAQKLFEDNSVVYNKTNDIQHSAIVRTIKLENLTGITFGGTLYTAEEFVI